MKRITLISVFLCAFLGLLSGAFAELSSLYLKTPPKVKFDYRQSFGHKRILQLDPLVAPVSLMGQKTPDYVTFSVRLPVSGFYFKGVCHAAPHLHEAMLFALHKNPPLRQDLIENDLAAVSKELLAAAASVVGPSVLPTLEIVVGPYDLTEEEMETALLCNVHHKPLQGVTLKRKKKKK